MALSLLLKDEIMSDSRLVYSTETGSHKKEKSAGDSWHKSTGPAKMRLETNGRGGKAVTVLFNLPFDESEAKENLKAMQASFGCGGSMKDNTLELRGDVRVKVEAFFAKKNLKLVRAGG
jgi:translation initiation factor 1